MMSFDVFIIFLCLCIQGNLRNKPKVDWKCMKQVEEVAWTLQRRGVLPLPPLEWDGSLGSREKVAVDRMGFLLNAYQVSCWYWEMVELLRKLILTGILVVVYQGTPPHLAGSLLTVFW